MAESRSFNNATTVTFSPESGETYASGFCQYASGVRTNISLDAGARRRTVTEPALPLLCYHPEVLCTLKRTIFHSFPGQGRHSWMRQALRREAHAVMKTSRSIS